MVDSFLAASSHGGRSSSELSRDTSEWAFRRHLHAKDSTSLPSSSSPGINTVDRRGGGGDSSSVSRNASWGKKAAPAPPLIDSADYQAVLKQHLELACAAVAMARASSVKLHVPPLADNGHPNSERSELRTHSSNKDSVAWGPTGPLP